MPGPALTRFVLDVLGGSAAELPLDPRVSARGPPARCSWTGRRTRRLLVVGTKEHSGLRRAVSGSVSHYCLSHAEVPVVAVPILTPTSATGTHGKA